MFTANAQLNVLSGPAPTGDRLLHQRSNAFAIEHREGIRVHDLFRPIEVDELGRIIARKTERRLRQVVRPE